MIPRIPVPPIPVPPIPPSPFTPNQSENRIDQNTINNQIIRQRINELADLFSNEIPKNLDVTTINARLDHTRLHEESTNIQTIMLSIIVVILVSVTFAIHLKQ